MLKSKLTILAGAVLAATPLVSKAVTLTYTYDAGDITFAASGVAGSGVGVYVAATNTITVTAGTIIELGVDESVTGNPNTAPGNYTKQAQPTQLGIASFGMGFTTSNPGVASFDATNDNGGVAVNGNFTTVSEGGTFTGNNITPDSIAGGNLIGNLKVTNAANAAQIGYGAGTAAELFNTLQVNAGGGGTSTITATGIDAADENYVVYNSGGTSATNAPTYTQVGPGAGDTINSLPTLTIVVGGSAPTSQPIISLVPGLIPQTSYGTPDGTIVLTGKGNGSYNVATATPFVTATTGSVAVTGFNPSTDKEVYALKLSSNGTAIATTSTAIAVIIADINGGNGNMAAVGVTASAVTGVFTSLFPGYDILLTSVAGFQASAGTADLGFDFSSAGELDTTVPDITVTAVAAVPEPATVAGLVIGASGLLLRRRKNQVA